LHRVVVYIDGFNLYYGLREKNWRDLYWLNIYEFASNLLKAEQRLVAVNYFTARISATSSSMRGKQQRQSNYLDALESLPNTNLHFGHFLSKKQKCYSCQAMWSTHEEKMTDVNIAVELLLDATDDRFDTAIIVSADSDLSPPIKAVLQRFPDKRVIVAFPPKRVSNTLKKSATGWISIDRRVLKSSQFAEQVYSSRGYLLQRPEKWRR